MRLIKSNGQVIGYQITQMGTKALMRPGACPVTQNGVNESAENVKSSYTTRLDQL